MSKTIQIDARLKLFGRASEIKIISGEGDVGATKTYTGKRTGRAVLLRLTSERCSGARWARALISVHGATFGVVDGTCVNLETGEYV